MVTAFTWDVELPERSAAVLGQRKPKAQLSIESETHGKERFSIPLAAAKRLSKLAEQEPCAPSSRAELLYTLETYCEQCAWDKVVYLVDKRDYSRGELESKLKLEGYRQKTVEAVLARAKDAYLVDDARFARVFISSKLSAGWGRARIERELANKGVDTDGLPGWPEEYFDSDSEYERALALASKRRLSGKNDFQKIVRFLSSKGYSYGVSSAVARSILDREEDC